MGMRLTDDFVPLGAVAAINARMLPGTTCVDQRIQYADLASVDLVTAAVTASMMSFGEAPTRARRLVRRGDSLIPYLTGPANWLTTRPLLVIDGLENYVYSTGFYSVTPLPGVDPRYLNYALGSRPILQALEASSRGVTMIGFSEEELRRTRISLPTLSDQRAIVDYLDKETAHIDGLVEAEQRRLETAAEWLAAAIESAVLGREPVRCSGVPSGPLVPVPDSWSTLRNKSFMQERLALSGTGTEELLSVSHLTGVTLRSEKNVTMFLAESNEGYKLVRSGDLVINTMWAWMGALGVSEVEGIVSPAYGVYEFTDPEVDSRYFDALFRSSAYVCEMTRFSKGVWTSRLRLYPESFLSLRTPFPPPERQRRIAEIIDELKEEADCLTPRLQKGIALLLERRQALITAAVTGELEVVA